MTSAFPHRYVLAGLLVVAIGLAGCGGGGERAAGPSCARADAAFDGKATRLTFRMPAANPAQAEQARQIICDRLGAFGVDHRVKLGAGGTLTVDVPRKSGLAVGAGGAGLFGVGRLAIYDWEANVIGPDGVPAPADATVTGGPDAGEISALSLYDAVRRAARRPATVEADNSRAGSLFYAADPTRRQAFPPRGAATRAAALAAVPDGVGARARVYEVKPDTVVVDAAAHNTGAAVGASYVLRDDVALDRAQIANPQQRFDEGPGATGEPVVTYDFRPAGRAPWQELTRQLAERGRRGAGTRSAVEAGQHLAIVVDDALLSAPYVDFRMYPEGIDADDGTQISGGFTIASARQLAAQLTGDPLPAPLVLASSRPAP